MRVSSFKAQYRQAPLRAETPPPPTYEPLSPVLPPARPAIGDPAGGNARAATQAPNGVNGAIYKARSYSEADRADEYLGFPAVTDEPWRRSAPLSRHAADHSSALGSPIDALASAAVTHMYSSPSYRSSSRRQSHAPVSPTTAIAFPPTGHASRHAYSPQSSYVYDERPSKRARSEFLPSPQYRQHHSRPATSHIPGWSYNVEQMMDADLRMYQDSRSPAQLQEDETKRLLDAQLLLDFHLAVSTTRTTEPATSTAKRWSDSRTNVPELQPQESLETTSPSLTIRNHDFHRAEHTQPPTIPANEPEKPVDAMTDKISEDSTIQTHTPPEENLSTTVLPSTDGGHVLEEGKAKKPQGWPKGKSRGSRSGPATSKKKKSTSKPKSTPSITSVGTTDQLHSPQSLPAEQQDVNLLETANRASVDPQLPLFRELALFARRHSVSNAFVDTQDTNLAVPVSFLRAQSVPLGTNMAVSPPAEEVVPTCQDNKELSAQITVCAGCNSSDSDTLIGEGEQWISCDGCKGWYHFVCAGFKSEREVRDVDKFYCVPCKPQFGDTTKVRKSTRAHAAVDYAGLNEGILKTSDDNPEHHYISAFKNGDLNFVRETFARLPPELISADFLEKTNGFKEPIVIPAALNPRPSIPSQDHENPLPLNVRSDDAAGEHFEYEIMRDDGQDKLDMVIPEGLTVRRVSELFGPQERVPVIDVKAQEGEDKRWTMAKWAEYYEQEGEKPVRNVISLEVSRSRLGRLIRRPKAVRDLDLQDWVWLDDDKTAPPPVQFYCLMSVADCYTDFHIDFGGSSVYYHIVKGKKVFFFIPPTKQNLKKYEEWCLSPKQGHEWLGHQVKECYRVDLYPGDTMLIPSGWIHAVWTPEDSLVIGGNFLTRLHYGMQIRVLEIEKSTKVAAKFRYPFFQKIMWLALVRYLEDDPLPASVEKLLLSGAQFQRPIPIYCETDKFGHNSDSGPENYNRRYYPKAEIEGLSDLVNYIWRTVMISLGKIEGITQTVRNAVTKSIPKGHGEPLTLARRFAAWIAWKRGNENVPQWAYPDATLPDAADTKLSMAQVKRIERETLSEALRASRERHSMRIKDAETSLNDIDEDALDDPAPPMTGFLRPAADSSRHMSTPKTSQLGPKRIACDACRKRRIRCKHKDDIIESPKFGNGLNGAVGVIDLSGSLGISVKRRQSDSAAQYGPLLTLADTPPAIVNGGPLLADVNVDPYALKSGRVKACADCRKSKRRCIHDEYGNVDPVKANEMPIPRGSGSKKRRISDEHPEAANRKMKRDHMTDGGSVNGEVFGDFYSRIPSRSPSHAERPMTAPQDLIPIDPSLQTYDYAMAEAAPPAFSETHQMDAVWSSIENGPGEAMEGVVETEWREPRGPSVEPLTPAPVPQGLHGEANGIDPGLSSPWARTAPSSPSERDNITVARRYSPIMNHIVVGHSSSSDRDNITVARSSLPNGDGSALAVPTTPVQTHSPRPGFSASKITNTPRSSNRTSNTPRSAFGVRRQDSKDSIKMEPSLEQKMRDLSSSAGGTEQDMASLALALQLQMEEHGLRRRSK
ncbi:hypothetical protein BDV95DRAFT_560548 [Massariosphaeria phaeospora]|uniref:JmjC domain-containing histone demethylation protein 1 n=1 Tax=Massariosphaeria phaeospora TaxID=100035 RepID=A0A7C8MEE0_9PLEO|nr:hypothetical protein BDV95DRAFT_560548 [Massariosphaeria phaeospora]